MQFLGHLINVKRFEKSIFGSFIDCFNSVNILAID